MTSFERQTVISVFLILSGLKGILPANYDREDYSWKHRMEYKGLRRLNEESNFWYPGRIADDYREYSSSNPTLHGVTSKQLPKEYISNPLTSDFSHQNNENLFKQESFRNSDRRRPVNSMEKNHHFHSNNFGNREELNEFRDPFDGIFNQQQSAGNLNRPGRPSKFNEEIDVFNQQQPAGNSNRLGRLFKFNKGIDVFNQQQSAGNFNRPGRPFNFNEGNNVFNQQQPAGNSNRPGRPFKFNGGLFDDFNPQDFMLGRVTARPPVVGVPGVGTTVSPCEQSCQTTMQFDPVCGDNDFTYQNMARFKCAVACGKRVKIRRMGACSIPQ